MSNRLPFVLVALVAIAAIAWFLFGGDTLSLDAPREGDPATVEAPGRAAGDLDATREGADLAVSSGMRQAVEASGPSTGVRGIVVDSRTARPLAGVEVVAIADQPSLEPLLARFRGLFRGGMFVENRSARRELGRTVTGSDGRFEITGLAPGRVYLDGSSDSWFVRTPGTARLARGEIVDGIELRASPGGRVRGVVLGPDGAPVPGSVVGLRPGLNAFLGQLTERRYRWLETMTDENGRFDLRGVPPGAGYTASVASPDLALEETHGIEVRAGEVTELTLRSHRGATILGRVTDASGAPVEGASVAMIYLDVSRVLLSADGRTEPIGTDADGRFRIEHVAAGRVAFLAVADGRAPSPVRDLAVVDGGIYEGVELQLDEGVAMRGKVVDDRKQPVADATVELRPVSRPDGPRFLEAMLAIRHVEVKTEADGSFVARGLSGEKLVIEASKPGYTTALLFGVELDEEVTIVVQRGAIVSGVVSCDGEPVERFRVDARLERTGRPFRAGPLGPGPGGRRRAMRRGSRQLPEGRHMMDRGLDGDWREIRSDDGSFVLSGIPPGKMRVRVRAEGFLDPEAQTIELAPGERSDRLVFELSRGEEVRGVVVEESTGRPIGDAQVTAYAKGDREERSARFPLAGNIDPEDFDFLGLMGERSQRSAMTDSQGRFRIRALAPGTYRFTARHPDMAKSSVHDIAVRGGAPTPQLTIRLDAGGGVEGTVTGVGMRPLADALMVAFSLQSGTMRSGTTDQNGSYRIGGLPPGQYIVFKSRMGEQTDNIPLELMSNMRLKSVTVRRGKFTRLDVHDETDDGVRVYGTVRENGEVVPRALVTLLGGDREGVLGMGVRADAAGDDGRYELVGIAPGDYVMQVSRFRGRPIQTSLEVEIPDEVAEFRFDIDLPTSEIRGQVIDTRGRPVPRIAVMLGRDDGGLSAAGGLLGMIAANGLSRARTDDEGRFVMRSVAAGEYRLTAGRRVLGGRPRRGEVSYGEGHLDGLVVDGSNPVEGIVVTVPIAGRVEGQVLDGSGLPVVGAEITYTETSASRPRRGNPMLDLLGSSRSIRSGEGGRFAIEGLDPGLYDLRAEKGDALQAGIEKDVRVEEEAVATVTLRLVRGAKLKVRVTNVDREKIPFASLKLLDGSGRPVTNSVSTFSVLRRLMGSRDEVEDSGWYTFGSVLPDTYTLVVSEPGRPEIRITRTISDGEEAAWDIDLAAEIEAQRGR